MFGLIRAVSVIKSAVGWFGFTEDAVSLYGLAKRAVAATATVAVMGGAGVGVAKGVEYVSQSPQERSIKEAIATKAPEITPDIREQMMKVNTENTYSKGFLYRDENHGLLEAILVLCSEGNALPALQCDDAGKAKAMLVMREKDRAARAKADEYNRNFRKNLSTDGIIPR